MTGPRIFIARPNLLLSDWSRHCAGHRIVGYLIILVRVDGSTPSRNPCGVVHDAGVGQINDRSRTTRLHPKRDTEQERVLDIETRRV